TPLPPSGDGLQQTHRPPPHHAVTSEGVSSPEAASLCAPGRLPFRGVRKQGRPASCRTSRTSLILSQEMRPTSSSDVGNGRGRRSKSVFGCLGPTSDAFTP